MKAPDRDQFKEAMEKELRNHIARRHWEWSPEAKYQKGQEC